MTDYKKLSEALQTIKDECQKHNSCETCPFSMEEPYVKGGLLCVCAIMKCTPDVWEIKSPIIRLLKSE